jgi:hypothetical protein
MRTHTLIVAIVLLLSIGPAVRTSALAQDPARGTTLVCINEGGDSPYVAEWTPEKVADFEARSGLGVAEDAVNPDTGDCTDFAGLVRGWFPGTSWLCTRQPDGSWSGTGWVWPMYQRDNQLPPNPANGRCPQPGRLDGGGRTELQKAAATAVHLTQLEADRRFKSF